MGVYRLLRDFDAGTTSTLLPGLALATVPTLLWALVDPLSPRAALLGAGCLVLLLGGAALRWSAPVVVGGLVGAALVLRELSPYAAQWPQWVLIGAAGTVLIGAGVTWEARLRDVRQAAATWAGCADRLAGCCRGSRSSRAGGRCGWWCRTAARCGRRTSRPRRRSRGS